MTRNIALSLTCSIFLLVSGLLYLQYRFLTKGQAEIATYAEGIHQQLIEHQQEQLSELIMRAEDRLLEEEKEPFKPMMPFFHEGILLFDEYLELASAVGEDNPSGMQELKETHALHLSLLEERAATFLTEFGEQMFLSEDEIEMKLKYYEDNILRENAWPRTKSLSTTNYTLGRDLLTLKYLTTLTQVIRDVSNLSGGKTLICFPPPSFFPVVQDGFSDPKLGEEISTTISIGKLDHSFLPEDMFVVINQDTLEMDGGWRESYTFKPTLRGKQVLEMQLFGKNPLTGEVYFEGKNYYNFHVR